jgi:hypothetical protein
MGNRGVICTREAFENNGIGIYGHWQMGMDSIKPMFAYMKLRNISGPREGENSEYSKTTGYADFVWIFGNFANSAGYSNFSIDCIGNLDCDNYDNGVYIIDEDWNIMGREHFDGEEQDSYDFKEFIYALDDAQPEYYRLGHDMIDDLLISNANIDYVSSQYYYTMSIQKGKVKAFPERFETTVNMFGRISHIRIEERKTADGFVYLNGSENRNGGRIPCSWRVYRWRDGSESIVVSDGKDSRVIHSSDI